MATDDKPNPKPLSAPPPPRTLNVNKFAESRAPELQSLHAIVNDRLSGDFRIRRDKRRRTTGHKTAAKKFRRHKRRKLGGEGEGDEGEQGVSSKSNLGEAKLSRRARRRIEFQKNPESGFCVAGDGTKRLRTHLWHAKRFTMIKRWGFCLPLGLHGRGRGSRALLRWFNRGALVHDASYWMPIQLEGLEDDILAVMKMVLQPLPSESLDVVDKPSSQIAHGVCCVNAMLYHVEGPSSKLIAPVIYMWKPLLLDQKCVGVDQGSPSNSFGKDESTTLQRKLSIWVHAAAFSEAFDALNLACEKQNLSPLRFRENCVPMVCSSREGQIARLEVMGTRATEILKKILRPLSEIGSVSGHVASSTSYLAACTTSAVHKSSILSHLEELPPNGIFSLTVHDPRESSFYNMGGKHEDFTTVEEHTLQEDQNDHSGISSCVSPNVVDNKVSSLWSNPEMHSAFLSDDTSLWNLGEKLNPPRPEKLICKEKEEKRLNFFFLEPLDSREPTCGVHDGSKQCCSILLLKHAEKGSLNTRWSIILPLSWVKVFWITLVTHGARAIGLRERRWIASNNGLPSFPYDFPDSRAYSILMACEAAALDHQLELRPLAVRPLRVPVPPPWNSIISTVIRMPYFRDLTGIGSRNCDGIAPDSSMSSSNNEDIAFHSNEMASPLVNDTIAPFPGCVLRTSEHIQLFLEKFSCGKLISLSNTEERNKRFLSCISEYLGLMLTRKELCFTRVLLHSFREGVFEEGAIICAPLAEDLLRWKSRSEEEEEHENLEITRSLVGSYFKEQSPGRWELHVPEDTETRQTFRWPIGFVTSGFVRGSSKPVAIGFVEAKLLARLQEEQLKATEDRKSEIFLFVRNTRSTAYRRALATVVLENQQDDIEFM